MSKKKKNKRKSNPEVEKIQNENKKTDYSRRWACWLTEAQIIRAEKFMKKKKIERKAEFVRHCILSVIGVDE